MGENMYAKGHLFSGTSLFTTFAGMEVYQGLLSTQLYKVFDPLVGHQKTHPRTGEHWMQHGFFLLLNKDFCLCIHMQETICIADSSIPA